MTSPRAVDAVEQALTAAATAAGVFADAAAAGATDTADAVAAPPPTFALADIFSHLPIFVVGTATQNFAQSKLIALLDRNLSSSSSSPSSSSPSSSSSSTLRFLGAGSNNAKNLGEFIVDYFDDDLQNGEGV